MDIICDICYKRCRFLPISHWDLVQLSARPHVKNSPISAPKWSKYHIKRMRISALSWISRSMIPLLTDCHKSFYTHPLPPEKNPPPSHHHSFFYTHNIALLFSLDFPNTQCISPMPLQKYYSFSCCAESKVIKSNAAIHKNFSSPLCLKPRGVFCISIDAHTSLYWW